mgnify:CR=1 FL=1
MLLYSTDCLKRNSKMKNKEQHTFPFIERLLDGAEVEWKPLGEVAELRRGRVISKEYLLENKGEYPVYSSQTVNHGEIGRIKTFDYKQKAITWTTDGANAGTVFYREGCFSITNVCGLITIKDTLKLSYKYLYYWLSIEAKKYVYSGMGNPKLMSNQMEKILIPIPSLYIQEEIVDILDKFTELEVELEAELEAELEGRKRQYEYYRNQLLSIELLNKGMQNTDKIPIRTMGEIGEFIRGKRFVKTDITTQGCPCIHYGEMYTHYGIWANKSKSFISPALVTQKNLRLAQTNDVIIVGAGETIEDLGVGTAWLSQTSVVIHDACFIFRSNLNPKYVAYFTRTNNFHDQLRRHVSSGKISAVNAKGLAKIQIPIPPLSEQQRIVSILDKFDTLTTSISEGLPKEIELRRKQYEYYRDRLLSFKH